MDMRSYLIGKKNGGINWSEVGYDKEPQFINEIINDAKKIQSEWYPRSSLAGRFDSKKSMVIMPLVDTSISTSFSKMFNGCSALLSVPPFDTSKGTNFTSMFYGCGALKFVPWFDTSKGTSFTSMFSGCEALITIPQIDTSNATSLNQMFMYCSSIQSIPQLDASKSVNMDNCFAYCYGLVNFGGFKNLGQAYSTTQKASYTNYRLSLASPQKLTHDSLMNIINNLYDIASKGCKAQELSMNSINLAKLTEKEIAIATNKGWTVL